jgi:hypothetical protein
MIFDIAMGILLALAILAVIGVLLWVAVLVVSGIVWCVWRVLVAMRYVIDFMTGRI